VLTITSDADDYARQTAEKLQAANINTEVDLRNEKISYKVREHSLAKIPVLMAVGAREVKEKNVSIRRLGAKDQKTMNLDDAIKELKTEIQNNPK
jgi:threonyl-tRNA synthetase